MTANALIWPVRKLRAAGGYALRKALQPGLQRVGIRMERYRAHEDSWEQLNRAFARNDCTLMLDVGANTGQFGRDLLIHRIHCRVLSFEPLRDAHARLSRRARRHGHWTVAKRTAVGDRDGEVEINVSANSHSSSLLAGLPRLGASSPDSQYIGTETVPIVRLDTYLPAHGFGEETYAIKIDTQGYEAQVLDGAAETLKQTTLMTLELSLVPLYAGAPSYREMLALIEDMGFRCIGLYPDFVDPETFEVMQVNAVFARN